MISPGVAVPRFTVILTCYNKEKYIDRAMACIKSQTYRPLRTICINDGSSDNSLEVLKRHESQLIEVYTQQNLGVSIARNRACSYVSNSFLAFLDADDFWDEGHLENLAKLAILCPSSKILTNAYMKHYANAKLNHVVRLPFFLKSHMFVDNYKFSRILGWGIHTSSCAIDFQAFVDFGGFPSLLFSPCLRIFYLIDFIGRLIARIPSFYLPLKSTALDTSLFIFPDLPAEISTQNNVQIVLPGPFAEDQFLFDSIAYMHGFAYSPQVSSRWSGSIPNQHTSSYLHPLVFPMLIADTSRSSCKNANAFNFYLNIVIDYIYRLKILAFPLFVLSKSRLRFLFRKKVLDAHGLSRISFLFSLSPGLFSLCSRCVALLSKLLFLRFARTNWCVPIHSTKL